MSKGQTLRALVNERLTAAAEEIFALVERTIAEYEEELCRSKEENQRKQQLLDQVLSPQVHTQSTDVQIQTESRSEVPVFKQEDERSPDVTCVIVKGEGDSDEREESSEIPASNHQMQTKALSEVCSPGPTLDPVTAPQTTNPTSSAELPNTDGADKTKSFPVGKRKRGRPKRVMVPTDGNEKSPPQLSEQTNEQPEETKSTERGGAETGASNSEAHPTSSPQETEPVIQGDAIRKMDQTPAQSKCPKSEKKALRASLRAAQNMALANEKEGLEKFRCSSCRRVFTRLDHLERHIMIHTGERSFSCTVCDKTFILKQYLMSHMAIHNEERLFSCPVCNKKFKRKDNLGRHILVHTGDRPFGCSRCDVRFALKKNLMRHMIVHNRKVTYRCSVCKMKFSSPYYFKKHTKTH